MASTTQLLVISLPSSFSSSFLFKCLSPHYMTRTVLTTTRRRTRRWGRVEVRALSRDPVSSVSQDDDYDAPKPTKLVTFLGKGGSGKTTTSIFAAQHYAMAGLKTCLVIHSQDPTAEYLLNCKIGTSPIACCNNLVAVRLETTKMLLEPLDRLKQADAHLNITQGLLEGVVGEELGVLPGMDSIFSVLALGKFLGFYGNDAQRNSQRKKFDIIIFDGMSTDETLRLMGATSKARLYLKYLRNLAEKTDLGRLAGPSILRLVDETLSLRGKGSFLIGRTSSDIWDDLEQTLEKVSSILLEPRRFGCYLVMDLSNTPSLNSALRYWGCAIQAGIQVSGAFGIAAINSNDSSATPLKERLSPLPFAFVPHISMAAPVNWNKVMPNVLSENARNLLTMTMSNSSVIRSIKFDPTNKAVTLFMPGFDKSEIKLYQYRGGSELLVEAGDQRRVIRLPSQMLGRVGGAKFTDRNLIVTLR